MASGLTMASPAAWPAAKGIRVQPLKRLRESPRFRADVAPSTESGGGTCGWSCAGQIQDRAKESGRCSPSRRRDRRFPLPNAYVNLLKSSGDRTQRRRDLRDARPEPETSGADGEVQR